MGDYRIAGLNTSLPPRHTDAVCWSRAVDLTREVGQKASEQVMDVKRLCDLKVSKAGDLMTGNLLLSADGGNDRLFSCTDLIHGKTFTLVFGDTLNRLHFRLTHPVTLESSHGLLVKCRGEDVCLMGNPSEIIIYKVIRMNSYSITNLPIPTLPHEAANKLYVDSNSRNLEMEHTGWRGTGTTVKKYYFDSYGTQPTNELKRYLRSPIFYNTEQIQPKQEVFCANLCLYVLKLLSLGKHLGPTGNSKRFTLIL